MLRALWRYRNFILGMARREFQARYLGSVLGSLWAVLSPLAMVFIYTVVFGHLMRSRVPGVTDALGYGAFLCAGLFTWAMFTEILQRCVTVFVDQGNLLKKMSFPRASLPAIVVLSASIHFAIVFVILIVLLLATGRFPGWAVLGFLPLLALQQSLALGLGVTLGVMNVFFRDVSHMVGIALQFWFWLTPIIYPAEVLGERARALLALNPLTGIAVGYQEIVLHGRWPDWSGCAPQVVVALVALALARAVFRRFSGEMVDYL
jgi:homopolymeric O-antigen transport system permease protein